MIFCLKCEKDTESVNSKVLKAKNGRPFYHQNVVKEQEAKGLLSSLGLKTPLSKVPLLDSFCFENKVNEIVNKVFMPEMHLKQPGFT